MNLAEMLQIKFRSLSSKKAISFEEASLTYEELSNAVDHVSVLLRQLGIVKGDRVAIQLSKCLETVYFHLACFALGAMALPLNDGYTPTEVEYFVEDSSSSLLVTDSQNYMKSKDVLPNIPELRVMTIDEKFPGILFYGEEMERVTLIPNADYPARENDAAMICYTSGTTGKPKGAVISHRNLIKNIEDLIDVWKISDRDLLLHTLPLFHAHGLIVSLFVALFSGATTIMHRKFDAEEVWRTIERDLCTIFMGVPTLYQRMLLAWEKIPQKPDIRSMRVFICGSAPLSEELFDQFNRSVGHRILERYGMTETIIITSNPYESDLRKAKSVGYTLPTVEIRIVSDNGQDVTTGNVGEVLIRGGNVFNEYWGNPEKTAESFLGEWFKSGDLGYQDPDDNLRLYLVGRSKELVISGGYNVYPKEVENVLEKHTAVKEVAVVGLPDEDFGERVTAGVVLNEGIETTEDELISYCKTELAGYKCPKRIYFLEELPRNTMGKLLKDELKKKFS
ncbi:MAG: AMP-binding protein [Desulfobacteraceae bacterium]|nr:AMP-binding protein [Desulfobacteraceae bacterium]